MTHRICRTDQNRELPHFQRLWDLLLGSDADLRTKLEHLFAFETEEFDFDGAFLSRIDPEAGTLRFDVVYDPSGRIEEGMTVPLPTTYCRETIDAPDGTLAISDARAEGWERDPAYERFGFESYLGTTVTVDDELYGTLCFVNNNARSVPITSEEVSLVEMHSQWVNYELNRWPSPTAHGSAREASGVSDISSDRLDSVMESLQKSERRTILLSLLKDPRECSIEQLQESIAAERAQQRLYHLHLPKLEEAGYIDWDPDSGRVSRGPNFSEVEPLVRFLDGYE